MPPLLVALLCLQAAPAVQDRSDELPVDAFFKDNLKFRTKNGEYEGYLDGFARIHARAIFDRPHDTVEPLRTLPNSVVIRQIRLDHGATLYHDWGYRVSLDFATGTPNQSTGAAASNSSVALRDAWVEWKHYREFTIRFGQFFEPVSAEEVSGARWLEFAERSPMNRIAPGRDLGLEVYGSLLDDGLSYYVMASHGQSLLQDQGRSVTDTNDKKEIAGLAFARPFSFLRLGVGGSFGEVNTLDASTFDLVTAELSILYLDSTAGAFQGRRWRADANLLVSAGPASFRAEVLGRGDHLAAGMGRDELRTLGWYAAATSYLSGEDKIPDVRVTPIHDWGAVELGARVGRLKVRNAFDSGIALPAENAEAVTAYTLSATWWYARFMRVTVDLDREVFSDPLQFDRHHARALTGLVARVQLDF